MRRTTIFADDALLDALQAIARRRGTSLAEVARDALAAYVARQHAKRKPLTFLAIGRSGRNDVAERFEELLKEGLGRR